MSAEARIAYQLGRNRPEELFPPMAHDHESGLIYLEGDKKHGHLGATFVAIPCAGVDGSTAERLTSALQFPFPPGTMVQISLLVTPDVENLLGFYSQARATVTPDATGLTREQCETVLAMAYNRAEFIRESKNNPLVASTGVLSNSAMLLVSIKVPCRPVPQEEDVDVVKALAIKVTEGFHAIGVDLEQVDAGGYLRLVRRILHMHDDVSDNYSTDDLIRDQITFPGDDIVSGYDHVRINETYIKPMSVKYFPKTASLAAMNYLIGDPRGQGNMITEPYMMTLTMHYPDQFKKVGAVRRKSAQINYQALGPLLRFIPRLGMKKEGIDVLVHSIEEGAVVIEMNWTMALFSKSLEAAQKAASMIRTYYGSFQWDIHEERAICWPVFWNTIPLFPSSASIKQTHRFQSMAVRHAMQFAPVLSEWRGTGLGGCSVFSTRRGQPMLFDFFDSDTSYNGLIFAESGAGKSFVTQQIIVDLLSIGAKVWVIDVGRSYLKLAKVLGGEFIEFSENSRACLNPFTNVLDIDEDLELLKSLVSKMASPNQGLDDYRLATVEEAIKAVWGRLGHAMTITDVAEYMLAQEDDRVRDIGTMLYPFTRHGSYGPWFDGQNNLDFHNNFVVLELEELKNKKTLQQIVLLQLIAKIQHEMFINTSGQKQFVVIDEGWSLLDDGGVAKFMAEGYRRFRKYGGGCLIVTQSLNDLYGSANGIAIAENSPNILIMQQKHESIDAVRNSGRLAIGEYGFHIMKTVHTLSGKYSEILFYTRRGWGVGRLITDRFTQVMFSTKGAERTEVLEDINAGVPATESINNYIARHG